MDEILNMQQVHGHELINLIIEQDKPMSLDDIKEMAENKIGKNAAYYTCSAESMNTDEMISFLLDRSKLVKKGDAYVIDTGEVCDHDD